MSGHVFLWVFPVWGIHWVSWICRFMYVTKFGEFSAIIYLNSFSIPYSFSSPSETQMSQMTRMSDCLFLSHSDLKLCSFSSLYFFPYYSDRIILIDLSSSSLTFYFISILLLSSSSSLLKLYFSVLKFLLVPLYGFYFSLLRVSIFLLISRVLVIACWSNFIKAALKSSSDNFNIWVISVSQHWHLLFVFSLVSWDFPGSLYVK